MLPGITIEQYKQLLLSVGSHKGTRSMSPVEVARALDAAKRSGASSDTIATALHLEGATMISRFLRLLKLPDDVQLIVDWGRTGATIAFTAAAELARLPSQDDQSAAGKAALRYQLSSSELKSLVQIRLRSGQPIGDCIRQIVELRPTVTVRHVFIGAITDTNLRGELRALTQVERDQLFVTIARNLWPQIHHASYRLGSDRFTISIDEEHVSSMFDDMDSLERRITEALARELRNEADGI